MEGLNGVRHIPGPYAGVGWRVVMGIQAVFALGRMGGRSLGRGIGSWHRRLGWSSRPSGSPLPSLP